MTGGCACRKVRYQTDGEATNPCFCHCRSCRTIAGAPSVAWGTFAKSHFALTAGTLAVYRSSEKVRRGFCASCGTTLTYEHRDRPREIDVTLASLDDPGALAPRFHIWTSDALPWTKLEDGLPRYPGWPRLEEPTGGAT